jgi:hypothetical protein
VTPDELALASELALAAELEEIRRVLAGLMDDKTGPPVGRLHARHLAEIDVQWPEFAKRVAAYAARETPC